MSKLLMIEIRKLQDELNELIMQNGEQLDHEKIFNISVALDQLIVRYMEQA